MRRNILILAGATASGKSQLALSLAQKIPAVIINGDSMQVYRELSVLTARPGPEEMAQAPHALYGVLPGSEACSAGKWLGLATRAVEAAWEEGKLPIIAGGTGLYLHALMHGIAPIPAIPKEVREQAETLYRTMGGEAFRQMLAARDPHTAMRLKDGDRQRLVRAYEVVEATGRPISAWQQGGDVPFPDAAFSVFKTALPRKELYARCDRRFIAMQQNGAAREVEALMALGYGATLPVMKVIGVPELAAHQRGEMPLELATQKAQQATRNYAKRQLTWFRHRMADAGELDMRAPEAAVEHVLKKVTQ